MSKKNNVYDSRFGKNDLLSVRITDIGNDGEGIGKVDGYTLFIKDAVIGDRVSAKIMKAKKNYAYAHLEEILEPSPYRSEPRCPISRQCGGCQLQNMTYVRQLQFKQDKVRNNIVRLGGFDGDFIDSIMEPIIGMDEPWRYRNKAQYPVGSDRDNNPVAGFYAGRTHTIIPATDCLIGIEENKDILEIILDHMKEYKILPYDESSGSGLVRHILIRKGFTSGQIMVCLVLNYRGKTGKRNDRALSGDGYNADIQGNTQFIPEQEALVKKLSENPDIQHCPHGRPIFVSLSKKFIEKQFGRI